jgi:Uma2 family endonuclease
VPALPVVVPFDYGHDGPGGWWIINEPQLHFGENVVVPDLAGWLRERMPAIPDVAFFTLAPNWVCEVLSPSTERIDPAKAIPRCSVAPRHSLTALKMVSTI